MKFAVIIGDGMADDARPEFGGLTALEKAQTPAMDAIAAEGVTGTANTIPDGLPPGSAVACMSIFGYDPAVHFSGRGPLEAGGMGVDVADDEYAFRCNIVTLDHDSRIMRDYSAGHITTEEGKQIVADLSAEFSDAPDYVFHPGVSYRHLYVVKKQLMPGLPACTPPHDITDQPCEAHLPQGPGAEMLLGLMDRTRDFLAGHPVNLARVASGKRPANSLWFWSGGVKPGFKTYRERFGIEGKAITAVDLVRGIAFFAGLENLDVPGITGYYDTNYTGKAEYAIAALDEADIVFVHVEAPDEASHNGHPDEKIRAIENIDRVIVGPVHAALKAHGDYRIMVLPDHYTPLEIRTHRAGPVPVSYCGTGIAADSSTAFNEKQAQKGSFALEEGFKLIERFVGT